MNIFEKFEKVTNYDLYAFMDDYNYFLDNYLQSIASYYKGKQTPSKSAFGMLFHLMAEANKVEQIIALMSSSLSQSTEFWDLVDSLSSMKTKLESTVNMAKWMRSSYVYGYESRSKRKFMLRQNQTMENLAVELGSDDSNQDWVEIAVSNALSELDYDKAGGNLLDVPNTDDPALTTTTVVDVMVGDNILGKDLPAKIELADDDLRALSTQETMEQSAGICLQVTKGSVPELPSLGISKAFVGSVLNSVRMSSLGREVSNNFRTDDSFKSIEMTDVRIDQDMAFYDFKIVSRLNNEINKTL